jgi:hypothetical protein
MGKHENSWEMLGRTVSVDPDIDSIEFEMVEDCRLLNAKEVAAVAAEVYQRRFAADVRMLLYSIDNGYQLDVAKRAFDIPMHEGSSLEAIARKWGYRKQAVQRLEKRMREKFGLGRSGRDKSEQSKASYSYANYRKINKEVERRLAI